MEITVLAFGAVMLGVGSGLLTYAALLRRDLARSQQVDRTRPAAPL